MKKILSLLLVLGILFSFVFDSFAQEDISELYEEDEIFANRTYADDSVIVVIKHEYSAMGKVFSPDDFDKNLIASVEDLFCASATNKSLDGYNMDEYCQILKLNLIEPSEDNVKLAIEELKNNILIEEITPNYISYTYPLLTDEIESDTIVLNQNAENEMLESQVSSIRAISDDFYSEQYGVEITQADRAWGVAIGNVGERVKIGIIDTGIAEHPDLSPNYSSSNPLNINFTNENTLNDLANHGTHVAGIIGARGGNGDGICGMIWFCELINIKAYRKSSDPTISGETIDDWVAKAINHAADNNIKVVNISGDATYSLTLFWAIRNYNGLIVASAGNRRNGEGPMDITSYLVSGNLDNVIVVSASNETDELWADTKYHPNDGDLFAPGEGIYSSINSNNYDYFNGTSMAAPFVTGTAALMLAINPNLTTEQIKSTILATTDYVSEFYVKCDSCGRLNTFSAILAVSGYAVGDVNLDGICTAVDARLVLRYSSRVETPDNLQRTLSDYNHDRYITAEDSRLILRHSAQLESADEGVETE